MAPSVFKQPLQQSLRNVPESCLPAWKPVYDAALMELDLPRLFTLVKIAQASLLSRRELLGDTPRDRAEHSAIEDALQNLTRIQKERLKFMNEDS